MIYLDSNVFIYAIINTQDLGVKARFLLEKVQSGEEKAQTSALTFDEVFWAVKKHSKEAAIEASQALLNFQNLDIIAATREIALSALELIKKYSLAPRDAIHAATALGEETETIISEDSHFDKIAELKRKPITK
ncbi:MAG: type II toxin-antitoxin system VapC family toxin [Candidatus Bathyarchaeota archaeon]|nr:type II toxin-antitoxin system VapC family toxin [Candidatus Bathyarchaeota archaeon]